MALKGQNTANKQDDFLGGHISSKQYKEDHQATVRTDLAEEFHRILQHAQNHSNAFRRLRLDIRCLTRALQSITKNECAYYYDDLGPAIAKSEILLRQCIDRFTHHYSKSTSGITDKNGILHDDLRLALEELDDSLPTIIDVVSAYNAHKPQHIAQLSYILIYPGDTRVCRRGMFNDARYDVLSDCKLEPAVKKMLQMWKFAGPRYEHIDILCSGRKVYDPFFFHEEGKEFFKPGRVFTVLWDTTNETGADQEVYDEDPSVEEGRSLMRRIEGGYTGPFIGPTTTRSFLVFEQGPHSCLCLPISTFASEGMRHQPDQHNYGMIYSGNESWTPMMLSDEDKMIYPALHVPAVPIRDWPNPSKKGEGLPDPPYDRLPTHDLLDNSRVDYRRVCIVQFNVRVRNVGILDKASLEWLMEWTKQDHTSAMKKIEVPGRDQKGLGPMQPAIY